MLWDLYKINIFAKWKKYWFDTHPPEIADYSWDYLFNGGKEIRAKLFCELWNYLSPGSDVKYELAFAIECIHVASIVLDDTPWMDNAVERRGKKTLHLVFSPKKAVLITYDLINMALMIWKKNKPNHIEMSQWINILKFKLQRLMVGQWYDLEKKGTLIELASLKTGVLFELVAETVAFCINLDSEYWKIWGNNLGILFQWTDDWNDREEDIIQKNRNAFNEDYQTTYNTYRALWYKIEKDIGKSWFKTEFGLFTYNYFTQLFDKVDCSNEYLINKVHIDYPSMIGIETDEIKDKISSYLFSFIDGKHMIKHFWRFVDKIEENTIKHDLWNKDEELWQIPNVI